MAEGGRSLATLYWGPASLMEKASEANLRRSIPVYKYVTHVYVCMCVAIYMLQSACGCDVCMCVRRVCDWVWMCVCLCL